jgi:hypothetical protein
MIYFTIDPSWHLDTQLIAVLDSKLELVGPDIFKVILSYLSVFDLLELASFYPNAISKYVEELLLKHEIIVQRMGSLKRKVASLTLNKENVMTWKNSKKQLSKKDLSKKYQ